MKTATLRRSSLRWLAVALCCLALAGLATPQVKEVIKILGVGAAVKQFGPELNRQFNRLVNHTDTDEAFTKVVPIITIGLNNRGAIGAAQVRGAKSQVEKVRAVAQPTADLLGEIEVRALIPVDTDDPSKLGDLKAVPGVGVSGIVDLEL